MTVILRGIFIVSLVNRCDVALSFFSFSFFLRLDSSSVDRSIDRSSLFHRQGLDKDERDVTYIAIISPHRDAIESTTSLSAVKPSPPPLRSTSACGATSFAQVAKEGRYSSFEDSLTRGVTGDSKREREREGERQREREKRRGSRLKTNTLLRERGRAGGESPAVRFLRVTSRSRLNNTR